MELLIDRACPVCYYRTPFCVCTPAPGSGRESPHPGQIYDICISIEGLASPSTASSHRPLYPADSIGVFRITLATLLPPWALALTLSINTFTPNSSLTVAFVFVMPQRCPIRPAPWWWLTSPSRHGRMDFVLPRPLQSGKIPANLHAHPPCLSLRCSFVPFLCIWVVALCKPLRAVVASCPRALKFCSLLVELLTCFFWFLFCLSKSFVHAVIGGVCGCGGGCGKMRHSVSTAPCLTRARN